MAIFFAVAGGLTAIGPLAGGFLTEIDWRAIFWVNVPVAAIALILTWISKPANQPIPAPLDYRGTVLRMGLAVLGPSRPAPGDGATRRPSAPSDARRVVAYELETPPIQVGSSPTGVRGDNDLFLLMIRSSRFLLRQH